MSADPSAHDVWDVGAGYEAYIGRWSRLVAREVVAWLGAAPRGRWLDVGCGTGENALHLAALGKRVMGVDGSPTAIARAREKAAARGLSVPFLVADALDLRTLHRRFETAVDCGLFHVFDRADRRTYAQSLTEVLSPGSTLHLLCFSDEEPPGPGPHRITESDLRDAFRSIFALTRIREARFERLGDGPARAWLATLVRI
jgi:ubiquinone/menaquinone biosynthesis C-methylase UbiE